MLNDQNLKAVGVVDRRIAENNAGIKIISFIDNNNSKVTDNFILVETFPPDGSVFGPSFFSRNDKIQEGDLIDLECQENEKKADNRADHMKYVVVDGSVRKKNYTKAFCVNSLPIEKKFIDLNKITFELSGFNGEFYLCTEQKVLGRLRILNNGKIEPVKKKRVYLWNKNKCEIIHYENICYVLNFPQEGYQTLDCMEDGKLFEWFREKLRTIDPEYVKLLDNRTDWRKKIPALFNRSDEESLELDKYRLKRVLENFEKIELSIEDIRSLLEKSEKLRSVFQTWIEKYKEAFKKDYAKELNAYKKECDDQKISLNNEIEKLKKEISQEKKHLEKLKQQILTAQSETDHILKNKERILSDFSIIRDAFNLNTPTSHPIADNSSYILETIKKSEDSPLIAEKRHCIERIKYFLRHYNLNPNLASRVLDRILSYKALFIEDIFYGIAFAEALGDVNYIIQQVEPDWMHFKKLWENGLGELWQSSHENPDIMHLLLLEDINLSSPECYARPLMDAINGIRKHIPYGKSGMPDNLRILVTKISSEEPQIGLPLYSISFNGWGAIGFKNTSNQDEGTSSSTNLPDGYISMKMLNQFVPDEFQKENIAHDVKDEMKYIFEDL